MKTYCKYCIEPVSEIENYELAKANNFKGWVIHHRFETHDPEGDTWQKRKIHYSKNILEKLGLYYNRPANELIFMKRAEHMKLHQNWNGRFRPHSKEHNYKVSKALKDRKCSDEHIKHNSEAHIGKKASLETKRKMSISAKNRWSKATNEERLAFKKKCSEVRKLYWEKKHESTR